MRTQEAREVLVVHLAADVDETILRDDLVERGEDEVGVPHGHQVRLPYEVEVLRGRPVLLEGLEVGSWDPVVLAQERLPVEADLDPERVRPRDRREDRGIAEAADAHVDIGEAEEVHPWVGEVREAELLLEVAEPPEQRPPADRFSFPAEGPGDLRRREPSLPAGQEREEPEHAGFEHAQSLYLLPPSDR